MQHTKLALKNPLHQARVEEVIYLAQVQRPPLKRVELQLLAVERRHGLWQQLAKPESITISPDLIKLANKSLALIELTANREFVRMVDGAIALPSILHNLSLQLFKLQKRDQEIKEWRESLVFQSAELNDRREALEAGEESLKVRLELFDKEKIKLERDVEAAATQRAALQTAWEAVRLEEKRLDNG